MNNSIQLFNYGEKQVRTIEDNGEVLFIAKDICDILDLSNPTEALRELDEDEKNTLRISEGIHRGRGNPNVNVINESGLYTLLLRSNKEEAKPFRRWVTHEVLPAIKRTGTYSTSKNTEDFSHKQQELNLEGAKILQHMIDNPTFPITDESKAVIAHEVFKLVTGHEFLGMLPQVHQKMLSATEIGKSFGVSSKKIGKIAKAHGLKPPEGESNEFGTWICTKSPYSPRECSQFLYNDNAINWFSEHQELFA